jgi:hypothetical protein
MEKSGMRVKESIHRVGKLFIQCSSLAIFFYCSGHGCVEIDAVLVYFLWKIAVGGCIVTRDS